MENKKIKFLKSGISRLMSNNEFSIQSELLSRKFGYNQEITNSNVEYCNLKFKEMLELNTFKNYGLKKPLTILTDKTWYNQLFKLFWKRHVVIFSSEAVPGLGVITWFNKNNFLKELIYNIIYLFKKYIEWTISITCVYCASFNLHVTILFRVEFFMFHLSNFENGGCRFVRSRSSYYNSNSSSWLCQSPNPGLLSILFSIKFRTVYFFKINVYWWNYISNFL